MADKKMDSVLGESYKHNIDTVTEERINGWAYKKDADDHNPIIEVRSGDSVLWKAKADIFRQDLKDAGLGNGAYAFLLIPDQLSLSEAISSIDIYIDGLFSIGDIPFHMDAPDVAPVSEPVKAKAHIDHVSIDSIRGWAFKEGHENYRAKIEVRSGDVCIASGLADTFREDLLQAKIGDGAYAFDLKPNLAAMPSAECECQVFVDGELSLVEPFILSANQDKIDEAVYQSQFEDEIQDFNAAVEANLDEIKQKLLIANREANQDDFAITGQMQIALTSIAELSARVKVIEQVLVKHLSVK
jgi:hypothetical protein